MFTQKKLYYYTSFGVLYNIITNKEIWLNSLWSMADYTEIKFFVESVRKDMEASKPTLSTDIKAFFKRMSKELDKTDFFAMSFSTARDDVAMWSRFAKEGRGVCLVFDAEKLQQFSWNNDLTITELRYPECIGDFPLRDEVSQWLTDKELSDYESENALIEDFIMASMFHKDPAFRSEREIRMSTKWRQDENPLIQYKLVSDMIRKSYILDKNTTKGNIGICDTIGEIIIGPASRQSERDLRDFLTDNDLPAEVTITKSRCPI